MEPPASHLSTLCLDARPGYPVPSDGAFHSVVEFVAEQQDTLRAAFDITRQHLQTSAVRRKEKYDMRTRPTKYQINDWVWCLANRPRSKKGCKWRSPYDGPFQVIKLLGPVNIEIRRSAKSRPFIVHVDKLKPCISSEQIDLDARTPNRTTATADAYSTDDDAASSSAEPVTEATRRARRSIRKPLRYR